MHRADTTGESLSNKSATNKQAYSAEPARNCMVAKFLLVLFVVLSCFFLLKTSVLPYEEFSLLGSFYKDIATYTADRSLFLSFWAPLLLGLFLLCIATALPINTHKARRVVVLALIVGSIDGCATFQLFNPPQADSRYLTRTAIGSIESIRAALASYAADATGNTFPAAMASWGELTSIVNANGATLNNTAAEQGFDLRRYTAIDRDGDRVFESYTMSFLIDGIPDTRIGRLVLVSPSGIEKDKP